MHTGDKPNLRVRICRWWKEYKRETKWKGYIIPLLEDFLPGYRKMNRLYWAVRHRTTDVYHKIDTGLSPEYYDIDTLIVHGMFSLLCRYVEEERNGEAKLLQFIADLESNWGEGFNDIPEEFREGHKIAHQRQIDEMKEALRLWHWWKDIYPKYEDYNNNPWSQYCDKKDKEGKRHHLFQGAKPCQFDKDGDPTLFSLDPEYETPEQKAESKAALDASHEYEKKCDDETTQALIDLIKLRKSLWT